jgi:transcriptional regulator with XRE-family HTH domain
MVMIRRTWWKGDTLKTARERAGLTQTALARKAGVHQVTIARLETGVRRPSVPMLQRLAKALGIPVTVFLE